MSVKISPEIIAEIADQLDMGMKCFYHIATGELESYPDELNSSFSLDNELWQETIDKVEANPHDYLSFDAMESDESFRIMETFVSNISDDTIRHRFEDAIMFKKPFQNFKQLIYDYPDLRQQWFDYKKRQDIEWVLTQLEIYNLDAD